MTLRSIVLSTAALLLLTAAAPIQIGFSPTAAYAQEVTLEAALSGNPAQLSPREMRDRMEVLRDAIESGALRGADREAARDKMKAYNRAIQQIRADRQEANRNQEANQDGRQAEQRGDVQQRSRRGEPGQGQRSQRQREPQAEAPAQQARRTPALSREMSEALSDNRPASAVEQPDLRRRIEILRSVMELDGLSDDQRRQIRARVQADNEVLQARRAARLESRDAEAAEQTRQRQPDRARADDTRQRQPDRARADDTPQREVDQRARAILADNRRSADLDERALRRRLDENRAVLGTGKLSRAEERQLRQQLSQDRDELRSRVASRQGRQGRQERSRGRDSRAADSNARVVIEQRAASGGLSDRDLERRVRELSRDLREERIARRDAEAARQMIEQDRRELRKRLQGQRERRRESRRHARSRNEVFIDFNIGHRPPQVIFAAEAMPRDIEVQLVAPPSRQISRAYTAQEISRNHELRETMPGIEIDTLNFDFGSAEVRPEEIDKLDDIADVIERIIAVRPDEVFLIEGHTDAVGSDAANDALSQRRAEAVVDALLDYYDIYPENLQTVGLGKRFLKIWTPDPEEENRRVTVRRITPLLVGGRG